MEGRTRALQLGALAQATNVESEGCLGLILDTVYCRRNPTTSRVHQLLVVTRSGQKIGPAIGLGTTTQKRFLETSLEASTTITDTEQQLPQGAHQVSWNTSRLQRPYVCSRLSHASNRNPDCQRSPGCTPPPIPVAPLLAYLAHVQKHA
jgi:hypothetical protein